MHDVAGPKVPLARHIPPVQRLFDDVHLPAEQALVRLESQPGREILEPGWSVPPGVERQHDHRRVDAFGRQAAPCRHRLAHDERADRLAVTEHEGDQEGPPGVLLERDVHSGLVQEAESGGRSIFDPESGR